MNGFALLAALWLIAALGAVTAGGLAASRSLLLASRNRSALVQARWAAEACAAMMLSRLASTSERGAVSLPDSESIRLNGSECRAAAVDAGSKLHRDSAGSVVLARLDTFAASRGIPRESLLTDAGNGRVNVNSASAAVLSVLPGFSMALAERLVLYRREGAALLSLADVARRAVAFERDSLAAHERDLQRLLGFAPVAIVITAEGTLSGERLRAGVEIVVAPVGNRVAVLRRHLW